MKTGFRLNRYTLIALLVALFLLGVYIAFITYRHYGIQVRGILGLVLIYLLFFFGRYSKIDMSIDALLIAPQKAKLFFFAFIGPIISYWATMHIIEMILFYLKR
jgi:hypothetical protein